MHRKKVVPSFSPPKSLRETYETSQNPNFGILIVKNALLYHVSILKKGFNVNFVIVLSKINVPSYSYCSNGGPLKRILKQVKYIFPIFRHSYSLKSNSLFT